MKPKSFRSGEKAQSSISTLPKSAIRTRLGCQRLSPEKALRRVFSNVIQTLVVAWPDNCLPTARLLNKLRVNRMWNNPAFMSFDEQTLNCFAPALAVIERELIYPHRDKTIRERGIQVARELHRILQGIFAVVERVLNALLQQPRNFFDSLSAKVAADGITAHRQRQTVRVFVPPLAEVENFVQTEIVIEKLALMNQQAGVASTFDDGFNDLIERHDFVFEIRIEDAQCEKGAGQCTRHGDRYLR